MPTPTFSGTSYQLNPRSPNDNQGSPAVTALKDGRFVTVYRGDDLDPGVLRYVIHNVDGTVAKGETIVDPANTGFVDNDMVDIAALEGGGFAITWSQREGGNERVYHRVYDENGMPVTGAIKTTEGLAAGMATKHSDIVGDGKGGFYLVWEDRGFDNEPGPGVTYTQSVFIQHFGTDGKALDAPRMLSDSWGADATPAIAVSRDGTRINVIWDDNLGQSVETNNTDSIYGYEIGGRGFYRADSGQYHEFHTDPDIAYSAGNNFMAVWSEFLSPGVYAVYGSVNGGPEFKVNTSAHEHSSTVQKVVGLQSGNFLVVWNDGGLGGNDDVLGQLFSANGTRIGSEFRISDRVSTYISRVEASEMLDGRVIVTWDSSDGPSEIYGRVVDPRQTAANWLGTGNDEQYGGTAWADRLDGAGGNDRIYGAAGNDRLSGGLGNDRLDGGSGADVMAGGAGNDAYLADSGRDVVDETGGAGVDTVYASVSFSLASSARLKGLVENLVLTGNAVDGTGNALANAITGNARSNKLSGGAGRDTLNGGAGADTLIGGAGGDKLIGGAGSDTVSYGNALKGVTASLASPKGNKGDALGDTFSSIENLTGSSRADTLSGNGGANVLKGGTGGDQLSGGLGRDELFGGAGADKLTGGKGADSFVFVTARDSTTKTTGRDVILDFSRAQGDKINLFQIDANTKKAGNQKFSFIGDDGFGRKAGEFRYEKNDGDTFVYGDVNGDGKADFSIRLDASISLKGTDFVL